MDKKTYEALRNLIATIKSGKDLDFEEQGKNIANVPDKDINALEDWVQAQTNE